MFTQPCSQDFLAPVFKYAKIKLGDVQEQGCVYAQQVKGIDNTQLASVKFKAVYQGRPSLIHFWRVRDGLPWYAKFKGK